MKLVKWNPCSALILYSKFYHKKLEKKLFNQFYVILYNFSLFGTKKLHFSLLMFSDTERGKNNSLKIKDLNLF